MSEIPESPPMSADSTEVEGNVPLMIEDVVERNRQWVAQIVNRANDAEEALAAANARLKEAEALLRRWTMAPQYSVEGHVVHADTEAFL